MILSVGNIHYAEDSKRVLTHYFSSQNVEHHFIEDSRGIDVKGSHPSWWKLLAHKILPGYDYIICWDLDLLPRNKDVLCLHEFNPNNLCLAWDSHAKHNPNDKFVPEFKYNGGLIGYPTSARLFLEDVFEKHAPGTYPSYEQYYLNEEIANVCYPIQELPADMNVLCSFPEFPTARLQHYTYTWDAKSGIRHHANRYFSESVSHTIHNHLMLLRK